MNKFFTVALLLVTTVALNAGSGCSSCPSAAGTKTTTRTSSCPSGKCGSSAVVEETKTTPATPTIVVEEEVTAEDAE